MSYVIAIVAAAAAVKDDVNAVFAAAGRGPTSLTVACTDTPDPAYDATPTHYLMCDMAWPQGEEAVLTGLRLGIMPTETVEFGVPIAWGEGGVISEVAAIAACAPTNLKVVIDQTGRTGLEAVASGLATMGLYKIPNNPNI